MKVGLMRVILIFFLMAGIAVAKPPDSHNKKSQPTSPVQTEAATPSTPAPEPATNTPPPALDTPLKKDSPTPAGEVPANAATDETAIKDNLKSSLPGKAANGIRMQWFGHAFMYLTSANGIRVAIDPFTPGTVKYEYPARLPADVSLVSCENSDRTGTDDLYGTPIPLRSVTGVGVHVSNGLTFRGIESWRDDKKMFSNTIYLFTMDNIRFCALGNLGYPLNTEQRREIGKVDILIVSVGNRLLRPTEIGRLVEETGAKWIVPVAYLTAKSNTMDLRSLEEFDLSKYPVEKVAGNSIVLQKDKLPTKPTVLMLEAP